MRAPITRLLAGKYKTIAKKTNDRKKIKSLAFQKAFGQKYGLTA